MDGSSGGRTPNTCLPMVQVTDLDASLRFYCIALGLIELKRQDYPKGRFTLLFLAAPGDESAQIELTHNGIRRTMRRGATSGTSRMQSMTFTRLTSVCGDHGVTVNRPPRVVAWRLCAHRMTSQSSCCSAALRSLHRAVAIDAQRWEVVAPAITGRRPCWRSPRSRAAPVHGGPGDARALTRPRSSRGSPVKSKS